MDLPAVIKIGLGPGIAENTFGSQWLALLVVQATLALTIVHRESLTFDEDDHMFAGYMMWKAADYGLNPEHPPLVKLLATVPILSDHLWVPPPLDHQFFKLKRI